MVSRVCEEFGCLPSQALRELDRDPELVFDVIEMRGYAATRQAVKRATNDKDHPKGPMADLVLDIECELFEERKQERADG